MPYFALSQLQTIVRREFKMEGAFKIGRNFIELNAYSVSEAGKRGVWRLTPEALMQVERRIGIVCLNPALLEVAEVSGPTHIEPGYEGTPSWLVRPLDATFDLTNLEYLGRIYIDEARFI